MPPPARVRRRIRHIGSFTSDSQLPPSSPGWTSSSLLVNWDQYLPGVVASASPIQPHTLMLVVGVIEIVAGIGVFLKPKIFAYVVAAWLVLIIVNLLLIPGYFDIALRDLGLALGALALGRLSQTFAN